MVQPSVIDLSRQRAPKGAGQKIVGLRWLIRHGYRVPATFVCPREMVGALALGTDEGRRRATVALSQTFSAEGRYAVRSAAAQEDGSEHSYAGQYATLLDVSGLDGLCDAIQEVASSASGGAPRAYARHLDLPCETSDVGVIVQEMVKPIVSGVVFTKNPLSGLDEIVVEAIPGRGDALLQSGVTPCRWVNKWGRWTERAHCEQIPDGLVEEVVSIAQGIAREYRAPVDLEWVYGEEGLYWVQLRPITGVGQIEIYSNRISREFMPGLVKPLVWSHGGAVNRAWLNLITELIGPNDIDPDRLYRAFHYQAYFSMGTLGRVFAALGFREETLELLMGLEGGDDRPSFRPSIRMLRHVPRMIRFVWDKLRFGSRVEPLLSELKRNAASLVPDDHESLGEEALLGQYGGLYALASRTAYPTVITPLLMRAYNALFSRVLARCGVDPAEFDLMRGESRLAHYDPGQALDELAAAYARLDAPVKESVRSCSYERFCALDGLEDLQAGVQRFLAEYGHLSDAGTDISQPTWRERPTLVLRMIASRPLRPRGDHRPGWDDLDLPWMRRIWARALYSRARDFRLYREQVSSCFTYVSSLTRACVLALGRRFVERGILDSPDDVFMLYIDEVRQIVHAGNCQPPCPGLVHERRHEMEALIGMTLPEIIYGDDPPPLMTVQQVSDTLCGVAASRVYYRGRVTVVRSVGEIERLPEGAVLTIPYSDVSWTPLFARAGAVIAESGGLLSHSSIIAREYGVPAVVSVSGACHLADGTLVNVDGYTGTITILKEDAAAPRPPAGSAG